VSPNSTPRTATAKSGAAQPQVRRHILLSATSLAASNLSREALALPASTPLIKDPLSFAHTKPFGGMTCPLSDPGRDSSELSIQLLRSVSPRMMKYLPRYSIRTSAGSSSYSIILSRIERTCYRSTVRRAARTLIRSGPAGGSIPIITVNCIVPGFAVTRITIPTLLMLR
jgi:hypothetical protein